MSYKWFKGGTFKFGTIWHTPELFQRLKFEAKNENNGRKRSWGTFFSLQHFGGKKGKLELWDGD